jgi:uncharacterized membrane protein
VEGLVDHHMLGLHHVKESAASPFLWDLGFLAFGAGLVLIGAWLAHQGARRGEGAAAVRRAA